MSILLGGAPPGPDTRPVVKSLDADVMHVPATFFQAYWFAQEMLVYFGQREPIDDAGRLDHAFKADVVAHLSPVAAKELAILLADILAAYERTIGPIPHHSGRKVTASPPVDAAVDVPA